MKTGGFACPICGSFIGMDEVFYTRPDWGRYADADKSQMLPDECFQCYRCENIERLATLVNIPEGVSLLQLRLDGV